MKYKKKYLNYKNQKGGVHCDSTIANAAVVIINEIGQILLLRDRKKQIWMVPGGKVDKKDLAKTSHPCWKAMAREYKEETNYELPRLRKIISYDYGEPVPHTRIFIGRTTCPKVLYSPTKETDNYMWANLENIMNGKIKTKSYVYNSLNKLRSLKYL